jgi:hypothetical protein
VTRSDNNNNNNNNNTSKVDDAINVSGRCISVDATGHAGRSCKLHFRFDIDVVGKQVVIHLSNKVKRGGVRTPSGVAPCGQGIGSDSSLSLIVMACRKVKEVDKGTLVR